jgi:hypothetical protein
MDRASRMSPDLGETRKTKRLHYDNLGEVDARLVMEILELERRDKQVFIERHVLNRRLEELEQKYADLVWLSDNCQKFKEKQDDSLTDVAFRVTFAETRRRYPQEFQRLASERQRGFNEGVLAATRLIAAYATTAEDRNEESIERAEKEFH